MFSQGDQTWSKEDKRKAVVTIVCFLTAFLAGITVWSLNGFITWTNHFNNGYGTGWDVTTSSPVDPAVQGLLAFLTIGLLFISIFLLTSIQIDKLKPKS
jgi:hypothetical protein